jgi:hypothetical protein
MHWRMILKPNFLYMLTTVNLETFLNNEVAKCVGNRELFRLVRSGEHSKKLHRIQQKLDSSIIRCQIKLRQDKRTDFIRNNLSY